MTAWRPTPRRRLRSFAQIGALATAFDLGLLVVFVQSGLELWAANVLALFLAAALSYSCNRYVTFSRRPDSRWVRRPSLFGLGAVAAGIVDSVVLLGLSDLGLGLVFAKLVAITVAAAIRWIFYRLVLFRRVRRQLSHRHQRPPVDRDLRLSVVVPAYNEGKFVAETVQALIDVLGSSLSPEVFEVVVVDDGSSDDTSAFARSAGARVLTQDENRGKGAAVRAGVLAARGRSVVFTDADLAYSPELVLTLMSHIEHGWDVVVGSRRHAQTDTVVRARWVRQIGGGLVNRLTHLVLLGHFRDTQCGLKGFRGDIASTLFERTRIDGFAFDVELFLMAEQDQLSLLEIPVSVENRASSSVSLLRDGLLVVINLLRIRSWAGDGFYLPNANQREVLRARTDSGRPTD